MAGWERVHAEWQRRVEAEYRAAAFTQHFTLWLTQAAASPDLIREGLRIAEDELAHSELSYDVYRQAGGLEPPIIDLDQLALPQRGASLDVELTCVAMEMFCLGETLAVAMFDHFRQVASHAGARRALDRIARDEVRHRDFGWTLLDWLLDSDERGERWGAVADDLPAMFARIERGYGVIGPPLVSDAVTEEERAWGLAPADEYAAILRRTIERGYLPRLKQLGFHAVDAWRSRG